MRKQAMVAALGAVAILAAACGSTQGAKSSSSSAAKGATSSATKSPIVIGFISSQTGGASSSYVDAQWGAQARIDLQNANGGIDGHPIKILEEDDQSSSGGNQTAAKLLVSKGAVGIVDDSSFTFGAAQYLNQQKIPVTGAAIDGPEWGQLSNMFSVTVPSFTPIGGKYYTYTDTAKIFKMLGVTRVAGIAYNIQSAIQSMSSVIQTATSLGISQCYQDTSIPFGDMDFGSVALSMNSQHCNGGYVPMLLASDIALSGALKSSGSTAKLVFASTGYDQNLLDQPNALSATEGQYTTAEVDLTNPTAGSRQMLANLKRYTPFHSGIPSLNIVFGYLATDLMLKGMAMDGPNPTSAGIISKLRTVGSYTAGGILPSPMTYQHFGTVDMFPPTQCEPLFQITAKGFVSMNNAKPVCGTRVATTAAP